MKPNLNSFQHLIGGNLCLGKTASINFESESANYDFTVRHNVWMPTSYKDGRQYGLNTNNGISGLHHRQLGTTVTDHAYIKDGKACSNNVVPGVNNCNDVDVNGKKYKKYYQVKGNNSSLGYAGFTTMATLVTTLPDNPPFSCGANVKNYCDSIWKPKTQTGKSCDNSPYYVSDMLMTGFRKFEKYADSASKSTVPECKYAERKYISNESTRKLNKCYEAIYNNPENRKKYLFNDYLVLKMQFDENKASDVNKPAAPSLKGKFIFIYENSFGGANANHGRFPKTEPDARVFVYLKAGASVHINCEEDKSVRNYFFFTKGDVKGFLGKCTWAGSVYATATSCAKIPDINGSVVMKYDPNVVDDMAQSGIVCDVTMADTNTCGEPPQPPEPEPDTLDVVESFVGGAYDADFVATGTQLYVTVESEYKSSDKDTVAKAVDMQPSILVMPRIVYLTKDAPGKLADFITVVQRTGAPSGNGILSCIDAPALASGKIKDHTSTLPDTIYECVYQQKQTASNSENLESNFYVVFSGDSAIATPMVHFDGDANVFFQVDQSGSGTVKLVLGPSEAKGKFEVTIGMSELPSGWEVKMHDGSNVVWQTASDGSKYYVAKKDYSKNGTVYPIFRVTASAAASAGTLRFTLQNPQGCMIGGGSVIKAFNRRGTATITRGTISDYCAKYPDECPEGNKYRLAADSLEDCYPTSSWVHADGIGCDVTQDNNVWKCDAGVGSANRVILAEGSFEKTECVVYIPENYNYDRTRRRAQEEVEMLLGKALKRRKGFGIVEVLVSAAVLGFLYLAVMQLQLGNRQAALRIRGRDGAVEVAQHVLDSLQALGASGVKSHSNPTSDTTYRGLDYVRTWTRQSRLGANVTSSLVYSTEITVKPDTTYRSEDQSSLLSVKHVYAKNVLVKVSWPFKQSIQSISVSGVVR